MDSRLQDAVSSKSQLVEQLHASNRQLEASKEAQEAMAVGRLCLAK